MFISFSKNIVSSLLITLAALGMSGCAKSVEPMQIMNIENIAIAGYDPVAYVSSAKAFKADGTYSYAYKDLTWYFENSANLDTFKTDPEWYLPKYNGYCAYELADGDLQDSDPQFWQIHNKELYLFSDEDAKEDWFREISLMLKSSEKVWDALLTEETTVQN